MNTYLTMRQGLEWLKQKDATIHKWDGGINGPTIHMTCPGVLDRPRLRTPAFYGLDGRGYLSELPRENGQNPFVQRYRLNYVGKRMG